MSKAFLLQYNGAYKDMEITGHQSKAAATAASVEGKKEHNFVLQDTPDLAGWPLAELAALYEGITGNAIQRFRDLETGQRRILTVVKATVETQERDAGAGNGGGEEASDKPQKTAKAPKAPVKDAGGAKSNRKTIPRDSKIKLLIKDNPRREGTRAHKVYELYRDGGTVASFLEKGGHMQDLIHDIAKGRVELQT